MRRSSRVYTRQLAAVAILAGLLGGGFVAPAQRSPAVYAAFAQQGQPVLRFTNAQSSEVVCYLYVKPASQYTWGEDRLGERVLFPSEAHDVALPPGRYDVQAVDCNGVSLDERFGFEVNAPVLMAITDSGIVITGDGGPPTVALSSQAPSLIAASPFTVTATFSEPVVGFGIEDVRVTNGTAGGLAALSATTYTLSITPTAGGLLTLALPAGAAQDAVGNASSAAALSRTIDTRAPTASLAAPGLFIGAGATPIYSFTLTVSDDLAVQATSLTAAVEVRGATGTALTVALQGVSPAGDNTPLVAAYQVTGPGGSWDTADRGVYTVTLRAGRLRDTAGNAAPARILGSFTVGSTRSQVYLPLITNAPAQPRVASAARKGAPLTPGGASHLASSRQIQG